MKIKLSNLNLSTGHAKTPGQDMCVMNAVAWFAGEKHSDKPDCACPVVTAFAIKLNDSLPDEQRQRLKQYIPLIANTRDDNSGKRAELLAWAAVKVFTPMALKEVGLQDEANKLINFSGDLKGAADAAAVAAAAAAYAAARSARSAAHAARSAADAAYAAHAAAHAAVDAADAARSAAKTLFRNQNGDCSYMIWDAALGVFEDILAVGRPDFSQVLAEIDEIKKDLPGEPEFQKQAIEYTYKFLGGGK